MKVDVKVYGKIQKITQTEYTVYIKGLIDTVSLGAKGCNQESTLFFQEPYPGLIIEGVDLKVIEHKTDKVKVRGTVTALRFVDENGETVKKFNVETCCIRLTEVPEEEPETDEDVDFDEDLFELD